MRGNTVKVRFLTLQDYINDLYKIHVPAKSKMASYSDFIDTERAERVWPSIEDALLSKRFEILLMRCICARKMNYFVVDGESMVRYVLNWKSNSFLLKHVTVSRVFLFWFSRRGGSIV